MPLFLVAYTDHNYQLFDHYSFSTTPPLPLQYSPAWNDPSTFGINVVEDRANEAAGTRSLKLEMRHTGVIWTGQF